MKWTFAVLLSALACTSVQAELITDRPELAARKWYLTIVHSDEWGDADQTVHLALQDDPVLSRLREQVSFKEYPSDVKLMQDPAWKEALGEIRPAFLLQSHSRPNGTAEVVFYARGEVLKETARLSRTVAKAIKAYSESKITQRPWKKPWGPDGCDPRKPSPRPGPGPKPAPQPSIPVPSRPLVPDLDIKVPGADIKIDVPNDTAEPVGESKGNFSLLWLVIPVAAGAAGLFTGARRYG